MRRIFSDYAYGDGPRKGCWWDETSKNPDRPALSGVRNVEVVIIGAGYTGLSAAYHLARAGWQTLVLEAEAPGWGASGRNGGFCCLGGGMLSDATLDARFGKRDRLEFRAAERAAVDLVSRLIENLGLDVDRHSKGETELAHRPRDMIGLRSKAETIEENYGVRPDIVEASDLARYGLSGSFHGALTIPIGFGLNPLKYLHGLAAAAEAEGAVICPHSPVMGFETEGAHHCLQTPSGIVRARQVIVATNGYSSEDLPAWLAGRYMPFQSNVLVTRPLTPCEIERQGWTSDQMCYDTRHLLHYFRLMPDGRFLFGMRGGLMTGARAEAQARKRICRDFARLFPKWAQVDVSHIWSGMVCLARGSLPFVGETTPGSRIWAGLCYHGNGVAMASLAGRILADLVRGAQPPIWPKAMQIPLRRFPFGRARRLIMPPTYLGLMLSDYGS
ncbi:FAD-binding oxidoreductase [uncultured Roseobacter sp.]|uniref:NAD(P)/FAD-dependent oxidoreductase n=1 Tax=uncultured Roseobacter sp. TaxID=114847 RepID=UPI00260FC6E6|nr:FAD-binding oxidoreductase [uncultured Roseobacter sp.]